MYKYRYPFIGSKAQRVPAAALPLSSAPPAPRASRGGKQRVSMPCSWAQIQPPHPGTSETTTCSAEVEEVEEERGGKRERGVEGKRG